MLRKFMKSALAAATICLLGVPSATALDLSSGTMQIFGRAGSYWGQISDNNEHSSTEDSVTYMQNSNEMNLRFAVLQGAFLGYTEIEARSAATTGTAAQAKDLTAIQTAISFMPSRSFDVTFGSCLDLEYSAFAVGSGLATFNEIPTYKAWGHSLYTEGDGIKFRYKHANFKAGLSMYTMSAGSTNGFGDGTATNLFAGGRFGAIEFRASSISETGSDNPSISSDDDSKTESKSTFVGLRYHFSENMSLSLDNYSSEIEYTKGMINKDSSIALQYTMKKVGPGNIVATYATSTYKNDETDPTLGSVLYATAMAAVAQVGYTLNQKVDITDMGLVYEIPMSKNDSRLQLFYMTKAIKASEPLSMGGFALAEEFTRKQSMLGAGVWLNF